MAKFKPGDICIGQNFECDTDRNGVECEVAAVMPEGGVFASLRAQDKIEIEKNAYHVHWADGTSSWCAEHNLRKKPPKEEKGSWDAVEKICGWSPTRVKA